MLEKIAWFPTILFITCLVVVVVILIKHSGIFPQGRRA